MKLLQNCKIATARFLRHSVELSPWNGCCKHTRSGTTALCVVS